MGLGIGFKSCGNWGTSESPIRPIVNVTVQMPVVTRPNPNPYHFKIKETVKAGDYLVVIVNYPDCITWGGDKILVLENESRMDLAKRNELDPHFSENGFSPIARFTPDEKGYMNAIKFAKMLDAQAI